MRHRHELFVGRKLGSADLQLLIIKLMAEKPRYGYEIIKELEERSNGFYVPSPGMVYPALTYLEEIGRATVQSDRTRKLHHITDAGNEYLAKNLASAEALFAQFRRAGERMERVRRAMASEESGDDDLGGKRHGGNEELKGALHDLRFAISEKWSASAEEQRRVAAVLQRAVADIQGVDSSSSEENNKATW